ncbi:hypothetical protein CEY09_30140 [Achromobacter marplatensis]|uniref:Uncharacterized protein n=1 Tax=Achromobacter marplatensis TaxID=470868 RepID=A0ABX9FWH1_9BURK|nr:hypothetical protein CEY09_30140 [Achromobacter marplatensis]RBP11291.1 hypothetical protein DFP87_12352 [Achromobacter marplatensis]CAB3711889.1 hypothetical protein LMG26219_05972 [Achromobacter marplatensis]
MLGCRFRVLKINWSLSKAKLSSQAATHRQAFWLNVLALCGILLILAQLPQSAQGRGLIFSYQMKLCYLLRLFQRTRLDSRQ